MTTKVDSKKKKEKNSKVSPKTLDKAFQMTLNLREAIVQTIRELDCHPDSEEIYQALKKKMPDIEVGTVYRNLNLMHKLGLIKRIDMDKTSPRFDYDTTPHHHVMCIKCGKITNITNFRLPRVAKRLEGTTKFSIKQILISAKGICSKCK